MKTMVRYSKKTIFEKCIIIIKNYIESLMITYTIKLEGKFYEG